MEDETVVLGELDVVAVAPRAREPLEIRGAVLGVAGVVPERHRHRRKRLGADQLALLPLERISVVVEHLDGHAQAPRLQLAAPHRRDRVTEREAAYDVGAARHRRQAHVALDVAVNIIEALGCQGGTRREHRLELREVVVLGGLDGGLLERREVLGRGAEHGDAVGFGVAPQNAAVGVERRAVVEHDRGLARQAAHQPVPHHPAAGGEVEQAVGRP